MKQVTIICTDAAHPVNPWLNRWAYSVKAQAEVRIVRDIDEVIGGDFLFLVSCHQIVRKSVRDLYRYSLVLHASALPQGRGMSPHIWQLLAGSLALTLTLLSAKDVVDSGDIWHQLEVPVASTELHDEINQRLFDAEIQLMTWALENCEHTQPRAQTGTASYHRRRTPADSKVDIDRPLVEYFDLLRVADPDRFPAFFIHRGQKYRIRIDKL